MAENPRRDSAVARVVTVVNVERQEEGRCEKFHSDPRRRPLTGIVKVTQLLRRAVVHAVHHGTSQYTSHSHSPRQRQ